MKYYNLAHLNSLEYHLKFDAFEGTYFFIVAKKQKRIISRFENIIYFIYNLQHFRVN